MKQNNKILMHILKHNPRHGEVYITWEGETFLGHISQIEITRSVDEPARFQISGWIDEKEVDKL